MKRPRLRTKLDCLIGEHLRNQPIGSDKYTVALEELQHQIHQIEKNIAAHAARTLTQSENPCPTSQFVPKTHR